MAQVKVTINLDDELEFKVRKAAEAMNISKSRWIAAIIEEKLKNDWPASVLALEGAWVDFPSADEIRKPSRENS
ncbi:MAG: CopG family transcriptional regulator [Chloroflexota bacterium]